jgi:hypothetical protein
MQKNIYYYQFQDLSLCNSIKNRLESPHILIIKEKDNKEIIGFIGEEELISSLKY